MATLEERIREKLARIQSDSFHEFVVASPDFKETLEKFTEQYATEMNYPLEREAKQSWPQHVAQKVLAEVTDPSTLKEMIYSQTRLRYFSLRDIKLIQANRLLASQPHHPSPNYVQGLRDVTSHVLELARIRDIHVRLVIGKAGHFGVERATRPYYLKGDIQRTWRTPEVYAEFLSAENDASLALEKQALKPTNIYSHKESFNFVSYLALTRALNLQPLFEKWAIKESERIYSRALTLHPSLS
jgi:hypothetical protein